MAVCRKEYIDTNGTTQLNGGLAVVLGGTMDNALFSPAFTTPCLQVTSKHGVKFRATGCSTFFG